MKLFFIISLFIATALFSFGLLQATFFSPKYQLNVRIRKFLPKDNPTKTLSFSFLFYYIRNLMLKLAEWVVQITPKSYLQKLQNKMTFLDERTTLPMFIVTKLIFAVFIFVLAFLYSNILVGISISSVFFILPDMMKSRKVKSRRNQILMELPFFLDLLGIILEAGTSFDNGLLKLCQKRKGALYSEWRKFLTELSIGIPRVEAYSHLGQRIMLPEFDTLLRALQQGEKMGVSIVSTIRLQSDQLKVTRKLQIQEKAMKLPVKMLFPLVFFIFPPIFLIIIGPGFIRIFELLMKM